MQHCSKYFTFIAGPCVIESKEKTFFLAEQLLDIIKKVDSSGKIRFVFKASFDKANRSDIESYRGVGIEKGLEILDAVKKEYDIELTTDIHLPEQAQLVSDYVDIIQIPAFLSRQTDLLVAAAKTNKIVNVKKGQFMAPWESKDIIKKLKDTGLQNEQIMITERGTLFGYSNMVVDMSGLIYMKRNTQAQIIFDATHSLPSLYSSLKKEEFSRRSYILSMASAAISTGAVDGIFIEVYDNPDKARCDGVVSMDLSELEYALKKMLAHWDITNSKENY